MSRVHPALTLGLLLVGACAPDDSDMKGPWDGACTVESPQGELESSFTLQVDTEGAGDLEGSGVVAFSGTVWEGPLTGTLADGEASILVAANVEGSTLELALDGTVTAGTYTGTCVLQTFEGTFAASVGG